MSWPNIKFSELEKSRIQETAIALEKELAVESQDNKDLTLFIKYPPFIEALNKARKKEMDGPWEIANMGYWYFESPLGEWFHFSKTNASQIFFEFLRLIKGFPSDSKTADTDPSNEA